MDDFTELREVPEEPPDRGEHLQEGAVELIGAAASVGGAILGAGQFAYARAQHSRALEERAAREADLEQARREQDLELRFLRAKLYGLDALDAMDRGDDYSPGFDLDDDYPYDDYTLD